TPPPKADCASCPYAVRGLPPHRPVRGEVPPNPIGVLVGSAPGREEAERGRPGVGSTGIELDRVLAEAGLQRSKLAFVYAIACRAPLNAPPRSDESAAKACRGYLLHQLRRVPADTPTLAMGR